MTRTSGLFTQDNAAQLKKILQSELGEAPNKALVKAANFALEAMNMNLVGGDPYGGFCGVDQFFLWRPFKSSVNHRTHISGLYHIGASTHPGAGLAGGSGFMLAQALR